MKKCECGPIGQEVLVGEDYDICCVCGGIIIIPY